MTLRSPLAAILLVAAAAAAAAPAVAQSEATTGIIRGVVRGPSGAPLEGALVLIQHNETGFLTSVETTASGTFARTLLPLGSYELIVTKDDPGQMERIAGLTLRVGETLNLDLALKDVVAEEITVSEDAHQTPATDDVTHQGATAEFGRSAGGFVNVITKSGTNELEGTVHTFRQWDGISSKHPAGESAKPDFSRLQYGFTLGGPIKRERVFFFGAYDEQDGTETKQLVRGVASPANLARLDSSSGPGGPASSTTSSVPSSRTTRTPST